MVDAAALERRLKQPNGLYDHSDVDRAAKALVPWIEDELANGLSISNPAFIGKYSYRLHGSVERSASRRW